MKEKNKRTTTITSKLLGLYNWNPKTKDYVADANGDYQHMFITRDVMQNGSVVLHEEERSFVFVGEMPDMVEVA